MASSNDRKTKLRKLFIDQRAAEGQHADFAFRSGQLCGHLLTFILKRGFKQVLAYSSHRFEPLLDHLWEDLSGKADLQIYLPRLGRAKGEMQFLLWQKGDPLEGNRFQILEPSRDSVPFTAGVSPMLILIPGLAFDRRGTRLGYGGGYYDRFLEARQDLKLVKVGVCFASSFVESLPALPHDIPMDYVANENELIPSRI